MALPEADREALVTRLAPGGGAEADAVAEAVDDGEELREIVVDVQGDVVAFTDQRALFVARGTHEVVAVPYGEVEVRRRDAGLAIDALIEGGRLILDVARGTFVRLAVVGAGSPPGRATWLPTPEPKAAPAPTAGPAPTLLGPVGEPPVAGIEEPVAPRPLPAMFPPVPPVEVEADEAAPPTAPSPAPAPAPAPVPVAFAPQEPPVLPPMPPPGLPPAGWNPDPSGRHWWRWWDGMSWTDHVADGGAPFVDPLPPRP
jgi:hypothetical protein